eukprot:5317208-Pyramimonas_sp.AAC.1
MVADGVVTLVTVVTITIERGSRSGSSSSSNDVGSASNNKKCAGGSNSSIRSRGIGSCRTNLPWWWW